MTARRVTRRRPAGSRAGRTLGALALASALLAGCTVTAVNPASTPVNSEMDPAEARNLEDLGGMQDLIAAARDEGTVAIFGAMENDPYRGRIEWLFRSRYGLRVEYTKSRDDADVVAFGDGREIDDLQDLAPYETALFAQLGPDDRENSGLWVSDYSAAMSVGWVADQLGYPNTVAEVLSRAEPESVVVRGGTGGMEGLPFAALMMSCLESPCGTASDGLKRLADLRASGLLAAEAPSVKKQRIGEQAVVIDWDFAQRARARELGSWGIDWQWLAPAAGTFAAPHIVGINRSASHPAAARLWMEFIISDTAQNVLLDQGAFPALLHYLESVGGVDPKALTNAALYSVPPVRPSPDQVKSVRQDISASAEFGSNG